MIVDATQEFEVAVRKFTREIPGPIQLSEPRMRDEALLRQFGAIQITARHASAADIEFARGGRVDRLQLLVEDVRGRIGDRFADRKHTMVETPRSCLIQGRGDGRLRRTIGIDQTRLVANVAGPDFEAIKSGLLTANDD